METKVQRWGNSLAVRIPKVFGLEAGLSAESPVEIFLQDGRIVIQPLEETPTYSLEELLANITPDNLHAEVSWGEPVGREVPM